MGGRGGYSGGAGGGRGMAVDAKMPELTGSAKQISWAESIRRDALSSIDRLNSNFDRMAGQVKDGGTRFAEQTLGYTKKDVEIVKSEVVGLLQTVKSASALIDNRNTLSGNAITQMAKDEHRTGNISEARKRRKR